MRLHLWHGCEQTIELGNVINPRPNNKTATAQSKKEANIYTTPFRMGWCCCWFSSANRIQIKSIVPLFDSVFWCCKWCKCVVYRWCVLLLLPTLHAMNCIVAVNDAIFTGPAITNNATNFIPHCCSFMMTTMMMMTCAHEKKRGRQLEKLYKDGNARNTCNRLIFWHLFCHNQRLYHNKFNCIVFFDSRFDSQTNLLKAMILNKSRVDENKVSLLSGMIWQIFCLFVQLMFWNDLISCFLKQYST